MARKKQNDKIIDDLADIDAPPKVAPKPRAKLPKVTLTQTQALVDTLNLVITLVPATSADALEPHEAKALAVALADSAKTNRYVAAIIYNLVNATNTTELPLVAGAIVAKRIAIRKDASFVVMACDGVLQSIATKGASVDVVETGRTRPNNRANGIGKDNVNTIPDESADVLPDAFNEAGFVDLAGMEVGHNG